GKKFDYGFVRPVLQHVLDDEKIGRRQGVGVCPDFVEGDRCGSVARTIGGDYARDDIVAAIPDMVPADSAGELPVSAAEIDHAGDTPSCEKFFQEFDIGADVDGKRAFAGAVAPNVLRVDGLEYLLHFCALQSWRTNRRLWFECTGERLVQLPTPV